jgi:arylsulfatase A-like enzyme
MIRRSFLSTPIFSLLLMVPWATTAQDAAASRDNENRLPNIVIVFTDDQGYADVGVYGAEGFKTPHLDRMASEGIRFTDFYVAQAVCSASRVALLTGNYPNRVGILGALGPSARHGIHEDEMTLGELCKQKGYATAIYGKWHLGHHPRFLPGRHGFDDYFGLPYSNDMWPYHPTSRDNFPDLPLIEGATIVNPRVTAQEQRQLTTWYTERAVRFIENNQDRPFFLYVPHTMPHLPLYVSDKFQGKSRQGRYGDVIMEIDWSVGRILETVTKLGLDRHTLVIFTSDNGPWLSYGNYAGSAQPLREGKGTSWDGGVRVPFIARWPGKIPAGSVCREPAMTIDLLPTIARLLGATLPEHPIDGKDIWTLLSAEPGAKSPHEVLYFYWREHLQAVRSGNWSLHFPHDYRTLAGRPGGSGGKPVKYSEDRTELALFDLEKDVGQRKNVAPRYPEVVQRLQALAEQARLELGDSATNQKGRGIREPGQIE